MRADEADTLAADVAKVLGFRTRTSPSIEFISYLVSETDDGSDVAENRCLRAAIPKASPFYRTHGHRGKAPVPRADGWILILDSALVLSSGPNSSGFLEIRPYRRA
jgi:hypothetical protein